MAFTVKRRIVRCISLIIALFLCLPALFSCKESKVSVYAADGTVLASFSLSNKIKEGLTERDCFSYVQTAWNEAVEAIMNLRSCEEKAARNYLIQNSCSVETAFEPEFFDRIVSVQKELFPDRVSFACALTDNHGNLLATFCADSDGLDYTTLPLNPYSAIKPLSVYGPAIESGILNWSSMIEDSPYKVLADNTGNTRRWPENASGKYEWETVTVSHGIKHSLNTVAVKSLNLYGVKNSIDFLEDHFAIDLSYEKSKMSEYGEEEIIGNIAMGYLNKGVSVIDMAGYYQVFANSGVYVKPCALLRIKDASGNVVFERQSEEKQCFTAQTACVMNYLLQNVLTPGGTGERAMVPGITIGGKTGTGADEDGNWFVGFSPEYTCAVWHGYGMSENTSPSAFSEIVKKLPHQVAGFQDVPGVTQLSYCTKTGLIAGLECVETKIGLYLESAIPKTCDHPIN